jgi:hypothetical protein
VTYLDRYRTLTIEKDSTGAVEKYGIFITVFLETWYLILDI